MPRYLAKPRLAFVERTRTSRPLTSKSKSSPGRTPRVCRTLVGIRTCPLSPIRTCVAKIHLEILPQAEYYIRCQSGNTNGLRRVIIHGRGIQKAEVRKQKTEDRKQKAEGDDFYHEGTKTRRTTRTTTLTQRPRIIHRLTQMNTETATRRLAADSHGAIACKILIMVVVNL